MRLPGWLFTVARSILNEPIAVDRRKSLESEIALNANYNPNTISIAVKSTATSIVMIWC